MKAVAINEMPPSPWKNGGGFTREIALCADDRGLIWRLSVADVERPGPFSLFEGKSRVLTVIEGAGLRLVLQRSVIDARPGLPVRFSGDLPIDCVLVEGPVRDFNLIYDPARIQMSVERLGPGTHVAKGAALFPLDADCTVDGFGRVPLGSILLTESDEAQRIDVSGAALLVTKG